MSAPASASTSSINMHNFDFGFDSPVPILNFPSDDKVDPGSPNSFTQELTRLQDEQLYFAQKIEKEKFRKETLEKETGEASQNLRVLQNRTKNGTIVRDYDIAHQKLLGRLEHHLQMSKIKLSVSRNENITLKKRVQDLRRDKLLHLQILNDLIKDTNDAKKKLKYQQKEIIHCNEKKHKSKVNMTAIKNKMLKDMEEFSHELNIAKININSTQENILTAMKDKMSSIQLSSTIDKYNLYNPTITNNMGSRTALALTGGITTSINDNNNTYNQTMNETFTQNDLMILLQEAGLASTEELINVLEASEEQVFNLYTETQAKEDEMERIEVDNKHLEQQVELQLSRLHALEGHHDEVKQELEKNIQSLRAQISRYEGGYNRNLEVLSGLADNLTNLLKNVAQDEAAADQQLLSAGLNDRNVEDFLGLIEQRIDDLIQMSKAAQHQSIHREDFIRIQNIDKNAMFHVPHLPSFHENIEEEGEDMDETAKLQPINIQILKDIMSKKTQKITQNGGKINIRPLPNMGDIDNSTGFRSNQSSMKSMHSHKSN